MQFVYLDVIIYILYLLEYWRKGTPSRRAIYYKQLSAIVTCDLDVGVFYVVLILSKAYF